MTTRHVETLGPAAPASPIFTLDVVDDRAYFTTRSVDPTRLGVLDLDGHSVVDHREIPEGSGGWALTALGDDLYLGMYAEGDLYRYGLADGDLEHVRRLPADTHVCDFAVEGGVLYFGTYPTASVYAYDPETDALREYGSAAPGEQYARSLTVDDGDIYVGVGSRARLVRVDAETGEREDVLPEALAGEGFVSDPLVDGDDLYFRTSAVDGLVRADRDDPASYRLLGPERAGSAGAFVVRDGDVYLVWSAEEERTFYRCDPESGDCEDLGPVPGGAIDLYLRDTTFVGAESEGSVWTYDYETGEGTVVDLLDAGMPPGAEVPFSMSVLEGTPVVAGHGRLHVHDGAEPRSVDTLGEAKATTAVGDTLYQAIYTGAKLADYTLERAAVRHLATIGEEQNRPRDVHYHSGSGLLFVATVPDYGHIGGALSAFDPASGRLRVERNVVADQSVCSVDSVGGTVLFGTEIHGGNGTEPVAAEARLGAWNAETWEREWTLTPVDGAETVSNLATVGDRAFGATTDGHLFEVDPEDPRVVRRERVVEDGGFGTVGDKLVARDGALYATAADRLLRIDPDSLTAETVLDGVGARNPMLAVDGGDLYLLYGHDLARLVE